MEKFNQIYSTLNPSQKEAVDHIDGAVAVLAKAGTGKTQVIGARIANMISSDAQINPQDILCLTFTEAGVSAMRERLLQVIGTEAYKVNIFTFHGFCNHIIQMNGDYFGMDTFNPASDLDIITIIRKIIDELPPDHVLYRGRGDIYFEVSRLRNLFTLMKEENWEYGDIAIACGDYVKDLGNREDFIYKKNGKDYKAGDIKTKLVDAEKEKCIKTIHAANLLQRYRSLMEAAKLYDFSDMIHMVIRGLRDNEFITRSLQERYQHILVDEFQDTNGSQAELIHILVGFWQKPNILIVLDDGQCIFSFQGAQIRNIIRFNERYNPKIIVMADNYRSNQLILDAGENIISNNTLRLIGQYPALDKRLFAAKNKNNLRPRVYEYETVMEEEFGVAAQIKRMVETGISPSDICVLYRKHRQVEGLMGILAGMDIAVTTKKRVNVLNLVPVIQIMNILEYITLEAEKANSRSDLLFKILSYKPLGVDKKAVHGVWLRNSWVVIRNCADFLELRKQDKALNKVITVLETFIDDFYEYPLYYKISTLLQELGIMRYWKTAANGRFNLLAINTFTEFVKSAVEAKPSLNELDLVDTLRRMQEEGIELPLLAPSFGDVGVNLTTVHGAKGLEWEHVFVIGAQRGEWEKSRGQASRNYFIPDTLTLAQVQDSAVEESRRLFYVAVTRAKTELCISYAAKTDAGAVLERSQFIDESGLEVETKATARNRINKFLADRVMDSPQQFPPLSRDDMDKFLLEYRLSPSHLNLYLRCPTSFYYKIILRIDDPPNRNLVLGNAVHAGMRSAYVSLNYGDAWKACNEYLHKNMGLLSEREFILTIEAARKIIDNYQSIPAPAYYKYLTEFPIRNVVMNGVPLKGNIDRIDVYEGKAMINDYKTGSLSTMLTKLKPPSEKNTFGGDMWRQAKFYEQLCKHNQSLPWRVHGVTFIHMGDDVITPIIVEEIFDHDKLFSDLIQDTYNKIKAIEFSSCNDSDCLWCNLNKQ